MMSKDKELMCLTLCGMIARAIRDNDHTAIRKAFRLCGEWNDKHPYEEIFMYEGDGEIAVEDDLFRYYAE